MSVQQGEAASQLFTTEPETREDCRAFRQRMRAAAQHWPEVHIQTMAGLVVLSAPTADGLEKEPRPGDWPSNGILLRALLTVGSTTKRTYLVSGSANASMDLAEHPARWVPRIGVATAATPGGAVPLLAHWQPLEAAVREAATAPQALPWIAFSLASALLLEAGYPAARGGAPRQRPWEPPTPFRRQAHENLRLCLRILAASVVPDPDIRQVALALAHSWAGSPAELLTCARAVVAH